MSIFAAELSRELRHPAGGGDPERWEWPQWVAIGFFASAGLGIARLALGIWAMRRLRARSLPIADRELYEAIDVLRAETSCSRKIEIRETADLASAATVGWRRPLLLLPADWRDWNETERLAVLAHEVAHVRRRDFLAGVAAQLSLALHFYHPLAHWLAARARLEQELAADAWAAQLTGGNHAYLATLAQMALRRDSRSLTWPARAFLPSRGTFIRRIEMLRNVARIRHASLSIATRVVTLGVLGALGLLVASMRWPGAKDAALAQPPGAAATATPNAGNEPYNLAFLPADAKIVLAVRPRALLDRREFRPLADKIKEILALNSMDTVKIEDVHQLVVFWEGSAQSPIGPSRDPMIPPPSGVVLRMTRPQEWNGIVKQLLGPTREIHHAGQTYRSATDRGPDGWAAFVPDERTLVLAQEDLLRELVEDRIANAGLHPWDEGWQKLREGQLKLGLDTRFVRRRIAQSQRDRDAAPGQTPARDLTLDTISPLLEKTQSYALAIDISGGLAIDILAAASSETDAKPVADTISALVTLARNAASGMRENVRGQPAAASEAIDLALQSLGALLDNTRIDTTGKYVHVQSRAPLDVAPGVRLAAQGLSAAQSASRRVQSMNNLKQIALAIHNYTDANGGHLPTPVLYGGPNKTMPYSWRVAILPYIEQNDLYLQYHFDEPWDGPNNRKLIDKMPSIYGYPGPAGRAQSATHASYFALAGNAAALGPRTLGPALGPRTPRPGEGPYQFTFADITDGSSNTIMVVEAKRDIPWTKPEDIPFDPNGPLPELGGFEADAFNAAFADGSVRSISKTIKPHILKALLTRAGGEIVAADATDPQPTATATPKPGGANSRGGFLAPTPQPTPTATPPPKPDGN
jgi:hypothetical protein